MFLGILTVATVLTFLIIQGMLYAFDKMEEANQAQPATALPEGQVRKLPPEPRLQGAPGPNDLPSLLPIEDLKEYRDQMDKKAISYGWVNKEAGVAHLPLDRAKALTVERGLPMLSDKLVQEVQKAEAMRKQVLDAGASAGRIIKE